MAASLKSSELPEGPDSSLKEVSEGARRAHAETSLRVLPAEMRRSSQLRGADASPVPKSVVYSPEADQCAAPVRRYGNLPP
jgi:hypothetical protein